MTTNTADAGFGDLERPMRESGALAAIRTFFRQTWPLNDFETRELPSAGLVASPPHDGDAPNIGAFGLPAGLLWAHRDPLSVLELRADRCKDVTGAASLALALFWAPGEARMVQPAVMVADRPHSAAFVLRNASRWQRVENLEQFCERQRRYVSAFASTQMAKSLLRGRVDLAKGRLIEAGDTELFADSLGWWDALGEMQRPFFEALFERSSVLSRTDRSISAS